MNSKHDIITEKINIPNKIKCLIKKSSKSNILIVSNNDKTIKYLISIYKFMKLNTNNIYHIKDNYNCDKNIYFLEYMSSYNLIDLYNSLINNGYKKSVLNFFK